MNAIEIKNLTKSYGKARGIIDISFDISQGEVFGFIGPNGAGKSTTIRTLLAFLYPDSGSAKILGKDCILESASIKREIGYLPSEVNYYEDMKVKDLLNYSAMFYRKNCTKRIQELSEVFEVDLNKRVDALSFGNKKKVGILQALIHEPRILILDEPTGGLDPLMQNIFFDVLKDENKKGTTLFFSSHILSEVQKICDRVAIIKEGRVLKVEHIDILRANQYKKVKVEFQEMASMRPIVLDGVINESVKERVVEFLYGGKIEALLQVLSQFSLENLWIEEPSLEEIFMHYYARA